VHGLDYLHSGNPPRGPNPDQQDVAGNFTKDVTHCPDCLHVVQLVPVESQVLLHARDEYVVDICFVEIRDEVAERRES
jgi:hypothetical protein